MTARSLSSDVAFLTSKAFGRLLIPQPREYCSQAQPPRTCTALWSDGSAEGAVAPAATAPDLRGRSNSHRPCGNSAWADSGAAGDAIESSMTHISGHDRCRML